MFQSILFKVYLSCNRLLKYLITISKTTTKIIVLTFLFLFVCFLQRRFLFIYHVRGTKLTKEIFI